MRKVARTTPVSRIVQIATATSTKKAGRVTQKGTRSVNKTGGLAKVASGWAINMAKKQQPENWAFSPAAPR